MEFNTVLLIGKPGSGKGTQAKLLQEQTAWPIHAAGDKFRELAGENTTVGRKLRTELDQGLLMPEWFATYLFQKTALTLSSEDGVIFDGFGRKVPEAQIVMSVLSWLDRSYTAVHIKVSDEEIIDRLQKRSAISGRADDNAIEKRLEEYRTYTELSIDVFRKAGKLIEIDGEGDVAKIHQDIRTALSVT